jgi:hypothetical protein
MTEHILLPGIHLRQGFIHAAHLKCLKDWREEAIQRADDGDVAASICLQATLIDLVIDGKLCHDWLGVMDEHLLYNGAPLAYSEVFGKRLHKFEAQYKQSSVHSIHTRWWIEWVTNKDTINHDFFANFVLNKKQSDGLIYDLDISETTLRHRMKTELTMSMAMSAEILEKANKLTGNLPIELATSVVCPKKLPPLGFLSMEYFRLKALKILGYEHLFPVGIEGHIENSAEDLTVGWCDFSMKNKVDAYMGTAKRTQRDKPIHLPLVACQVSSLMDQIQGCEKKAMVERRYNEYCCHLNNNPMDIPAFQMRDIPIKFGADRTPIEVICASFLISQCKND